MKESQLQEFGRKLQKARMDRGLSQHELADKAGMSQNHLCNIENGKVNLKLSMYYDLLEALDIVVPDPFQYDHL